MGEAGMNIALIFAGGTGQRMNSRTRPKQFLELNGKPILIHTLEHFEVHPDIDGIVVVCLKDWIGYLEELADRFRIRKLRWIVEGGATGQESIRNGLYALDRDESVPKGSVILIHDGVRPLITADLITRNIETAREFGNAITVTPATETIIRVSAGREVSDIVDRSVCMLARAPQTFVLSDILAAHRRAAEDNYREAIDSATLMTHYGASLHSVEGPVENIKITTPADFYIFRAITEARENSQIWGL